MAGESSPSWETWDRICRTYGWPQTFVRMADPGASLQLLLFKTQLAEARSRAGWSVEEEAAQRIGVSIPEYREFEAGARWPTDEEWDRIGAATGVSRTIGLADP